MGSGGSLTLWPPSYEAGAYAYRKGQAPSEKVGSKIDAPGWIDIRAVMQTLFPAPSLMAGHSNREKSN
jgi:hypothetical protein